MSDLILIAANDAYLVWIAHVLLLLASLYPNVGNNIPAKSNQLSLRELILQGKSCGHAIR